MHTALLWLAACTPAPDSGTVDTGQDLTAPDTDLADTDVVDTDGIDTDTVDTDVLDTDVLDTDTVDTDTVDTDLPSPQPDFSLIDASPTSPRSGQSVSPRDYLQKVSGWYFTHAT